MPRVLLLALIPAMAPYHVNLVLLKSYTALSVKVFSSWRSFAKLRKKPTIGRSWRPCEQALLSLFAAWCLTMHLMANFCVCVDIVFAKTRYSKFITTLFLFLCRVYTPEENIIQTYEVRFFIKLLYTITL